MQPKSWRTTVWGVLAGVATLLGFLVKWHATGELPTFQEITVAITGIAAAIGLGAAADHKNVAP